MPVLKNSKHERFAQLIVQGTTQRFAYKSAISPNIKDTTADTEASRLLGNPKIRSRVDELNTSAANKVVLTKAWILDNLTKNTQAAMFEGQRGAANRGFELLGREKGLFVERKNITVRSLSDLSEEELRDVVDELGDTPPGPEEATEEGGSDGASAAGFRTVPARRTRE